MCIRLRPEVGLESMFFVLLRRFIAYGVAINVLIFAFTCQNPFATREPEPPSGLQTSWIQPVTPEILLDNFRGAIREKNIENYIRCFGSTESIRQGFIFVPEASVANNYPGVFTGWSIEKERTFIEGLFSFLPADSVSSLILTDVEEFQYTDSVQTTKDYDLLLAPADPAIPKQVIGRLKFSLRRGEDALWYIAFWVDFKTVDSHVWSFLKTLF